MVLPSMNQAVARAWAHDEFGDVKLGDARLTSRVVQTAAGALRNPSSTILGTFGRTAAAEGAFRLVENDRVSVLALADAAHRAAARRCDAFASVVVPIDGTSMRVRDPRNLRGLGPLSNFRDKARGIQAFHALAVSPEGVTLGVLGRELWLRAETATKPKGCKNTQPLVTRESYRWVTMLASVQAQMQRHAPGCTPWFQLDRGGDCWAVIEHAVRHELTLTVRANQNRLLKRGGGTSALLFNAIRAVAPCGELHVEIPAGRGRVARSATLLLRSARFAIPIPSVKGRHHLREVSVVMASEKDPPADKSARIEWVLITTRRVCSAADAVEVVRAYTRRWRIEEFHRTWKNGACAIESTRLRAYDHIQRWAVIMGSVAARIEHLKFTSRSAPELPADDFYSRDEIDAVILLTSQHRKMTYEVGQTPTMGEVTRWIADLGGYAGSKKSLPPGSTVIARGLERIGSAAQVLALQRLSRKKPATKRK
jgi:hypothetical protein